MTQKSQEDEMDGQERRSVLQGGEEVNSAAVPGLQPAEGGPGAAGRRQQ